MFCYDKYTDTLVLKEAGDGLRILKGDCLAQPTVLSPPPPLTLLLPMFGVRSGTQSEPPGCLT